MDKVKLTREQAKVIESKMAFRHMSIKYHVMNNWDTDYERCLNNLTLDELIRAFYIGYEVEETFEVGDWIYSKQVEKFIKIEDEGQLEGYNKFPSYYRSATPEEIEKEKERRWWAKHGREVWEIRKGDIVINKVNKLLFKVNESIKKDFEEVSIRENYKVVCFAEGRKDLKE